MNRLFRFGVVSSNAQSGEAWAAQARRVEELGYSTLLIVDRFVTPLAPLTSLAFAACATKTLRVGSHVFCNGYRHPALLAREMASLDFLSGGRVELGLGSGVSEPDFQQLGLPAESAGTRVSRLEEALRIIKPLLRGETVDISGNYYTVTDLKNPLVPVQKPHLPLFLAGSGRRMLTIAAREADIIAVTAGYSKPGASAAESVSLEQKMEWVCAAAGERLKELEFAQTVYGLTLTDSPAEVKPWRGWPVAQLPMSTAQALEHLQELRQKYGFSYFQIADNQMENFAPVVARLAGR